MAFIFVLTASNTRADNLPTTHNKTPQIENKCYLKGIKKALTVKSTLLIYLLYVFLNQAR